MVRYVALLRAINAGAGRTVKMRSIRQVFESLGFSNVTTFGASGNIMFETRARSERRLQRKIEKQLREAFGFQVATFIRTAAELAWTAEYQPFSKSKVKTADEFHIIFLSERLDRKLSRKLRALQTETDEFRSQGRELFWLGRRKKDGSNFATVPLEKALGRSLTIRSATTVKKLAAKYPPAKG